MSEDTDRILLAYHDLFRIAGGEAARIVLEDLAYVSYRDTTTTTEDAQGRFDPYRMAFNEGQRSLYNKILLRIEEGAKIQGLAPEAPKYATSNLFEERAELTVA